MQSYTALGKLQEAGEAEKFTYREIYKIKGTKVFNFVVPRSIPEPHFVLKSLYLNYFPTQLPSCALRASAGSPVEVAAAVR